MRRFKLLLVLNIAALLTLTACATTLLTGTWENRANYRPVIDDVAVFITSGQPEVRQAVEQEMVEQLRQRQIKAVAGSKFYAGGAILPVFVLWDKFKAENVRFALVTREFKRDGNLNRPRSFDVPADYLKFYEYFSSSTYEPAVQENFSDYPHVSLETSLYDVQNRQIVMSIISDTIKKGDLDEVVRNFGHEVLMHMAEKGYLKQ